MYKLVAVDLDGTMLNSYGEVTEKTKKSIKKAMSKGVEVVIASGRPIESIKNIAKEIGSKNYFIAGNGTILYDIKNEKIIYENYIKMQKILEIISICEKNDIYYNIYTDKEIITPRLQYNVLYYYKENNGRDEKKQTKISIIENIYEYIKNEGEKRNIKYLKMTICDKDPIIFKNCIKKIKKIKGIEILDISHMANKKIRQGNKTVKIEYCYTEIVAKNVDKWAAVKYLIEKLNIKQDEVIAIGDNFNDKKMIENAGLGIVMQGSTPQVVEVADYVTADNNSDGVGKALDKFL